MSEKIAIIGDGCASLSFAAMAQNSDLDITVLKPKNAPEGKNHAWGFWSDSALVDAQNMARHSWNKWAIVTHEDCAVMESVTKKYHMFKRFDWLDNRKGLAINSGVEFKEESNVDLEDFSKVFDTRPPTIPAGSVLQHFYGVDVKSDVDVFDESTVLLMDFRTDQSKGMHFIYVYRTQNEKL